MDLCMTIRFLYSLVIWIMYVTAAKSSSSPRWLKKLVHSDLLSRTKRFDFGYKAESQTPEKYLKDCCKNNGLCILGSFCQCHKQFYGRYCQYEVRRSHCGPVQHGEWFQSNCSLCRCHNGKSVCIEGSFGKCDAKVFSRDYEPADPANIVQIFPLLPGENHLENSWADDNELPSSGGRHHPHLVLLTVIAFTLSIGVV